MVKIKKIVAAAIVAVAVGTVSTTAFADIGSGDEFTFKLTAYDDTEFSNFARKYTSYSTPAHATAHTGAKSTAPVSVVVYDRTEPEYYNTLTSTATIKANYETVYMTYYATGTPDYRDDFIMNGYSRHNITISGLWTA